MSDDIETSELTEGDVYKGQTVVGFTAEGDPIGENGRNLVKGCFARGNSFGQGRKKGSRNRLTQLMLDRVAGSPLSPDELLLKLMTDSECDEKLRLQAAMKLVDIVYPKASSIEMDLNDTRETSKDDMDARIKSLLGKAVEQI